MSCSVCSHWSCIIIYLSIYLTRGCDMLGLYCKVLYLPSFSLLLTPILVTPIMYLFYPKSFSIPSNVFDASDILLVMREMICQSRGNSFSSIRFVWLSTCPCRGRHIFARSWQVRFLACWCTSGNTFLSSWWWVPGHWLQRSAVSHSLKSRICLLLWNHYFRLDTMNLRKNLKLCHSFFFYSFSFLKSYHSQLLNYY